MFSSENYKGSFADYVSDDSKPDVDSMLRCGYETANLLTDALNAT